MVTKFKLVNNFDARQVKLRYGFNFAVVDINKPTEEERKIVHDQMLKYSSLGCKLIIYWCEIIQHDHIDYLHVVFGEALDVIADTEEN